MPNYLTFGKEKIEYKKFEQDGSYVYIDKLKPNKKFTNWILSHANAKKKTIRRKNLLLTKGKKCYNTKGCFVTWFTTSDLDKKTITYDVTICFKSIEKINDKSNP